jgi:hypothetical protein
MHTHTVVARSPNPLSLFLAAFLCSSGQRLCRIRCSQPLSHDAAAHPTRLHICLNELLPCLLAAGLFSVFSAIFV